MATLYKYNDYEFRDDAGEFTPEEVKKQLTQYYPELAKAEAKESQDADGNKVVTFVKQAGTKGAPSTKGLPDRSQDVPPMSDIDLFRLEEQVRCARNGNRTVELDPEQVLSLVCEAWYLRSVLSEPAPGVTVDARV